MKMILINLCKADMQSSVACVAPETFIRNFGQVVDGVVQHKRG